MSHDTTQLNELLRSFCLEKIALSEDFAKAEAAILDDLLATLADAMGHALEDFDDALLSDKDTSWHIKDKKRRSLLTEFGEVCFSRRVYIDDCADRRILLDEVLGIRPRKYLSPGAFEALAHFGAEIPYGRAAKTCFRHCEGDVSAQTTMGTLREVGDLLEDKAAQQRHELFSLGILPQAKGSSPELFVECDGIWVALQGEDKSGVEIKAMSAYAGKEEGSRISCMHHGAVSKPSRFFEEGIARMGSHFSLDGLKRVWSASDGGAWEKKMPDYLPVKEVSHRLDPWHINRAVKTAWPNSDDNAVLFELLGQGDIDSLLALLHLRYDSGYGDKDKTYSLITYIENNYESIRADAPSMGTMESSCAHLYAARMKAFGGAWSVEGASDMARIRSYVFSGDELPMPKQEQVFSEEDMRRRDAAWIRIQQKSIHHVLESEGEGYEPPQGHIAAFSTRTPASAMLGLLKRE